MIIMMIYENKRNGDRVNVEASSLALGEVEATYISSNKHEVGESTFIKIGTFKRWWSLVEELIEEADNDIKEDIVDTESELTDEEYAKIGLEIAEQTKKKIKKVKTPKIDRTQDILNIGAFIGNTYNNKYYESVKCYKIIKNDKTVAEIYPRRKEIEVRVKSIKDDFDSDIRYKDGYKYYLPVHYFLDYTSDYIKLITDLIQ